MGFNDLDSLDPTRLPALQCSLVDPAREH
jgi:hypothetical protein